MNKKGQGGLSMNTIIIAIIAIIVLLLIVTFFTGGMSTVFGKIRGVFTAGTAGFDIDLTKANCQSLCQRAINLGQDATSAAYCQETFQVDLSRNDKIESNEENVKCNQIPGVSCPGGPC